MSTQVISSIYSTSDSIPHVEQSASEEITEEIAATQDEEVEETQEDKDRKEQGKIQTISLSHYKQTF